MNKRVVALDIGDVRIGIAVSDPTRTISSPVEVIQRVGWGPDSKRIKAICDRYETNEVVSGLPLNMDGSEGFQAEKVRQLCNQLEKTGLTVHFQDERLSTVTAEEMLLEDNMSREKRKQHVDSLAASVILRQWLDEQKSKEGKPDMEKYPNEGMCPEDADRRDDDEFIELIDENGESVSFEHLATLEYQGEAYLVLSPAEQADADSDDQEILILRIDQDEQGLDVYTMPDDDVQEAVFEYFLTVIDEQDDGAEQ